MVTIEIDGLLEWIKRIWTLWSDFFHVITSMASFDIKPTAMTFREHCSSWNLCSQFIMFQTNCLASHVSFLNKTGVRFRSQTNHNLFMMDFLPFGIYSFRKNVWAILIISLDLLTCTAKVHIWKSVNHAGLCRWQTVQQLSEWLLLLVWVQSSRMFELFLYGSHWSVL